MVVFGSVLKELRRKAGLTQKALADKLGVTKSVISYYELAERTPSPEMLLKIANVFHVSTDYLLGREKIESDFLDLSGLAENDKRILRELTASLREKKSV
ncbi:MAG: helix-turn-helix transcriptional regulator [Candidatus Faecousia sp.]|nr:helix-turn-helix transcriptional regulator [Candidatus Faecousia sp.]